MTDDDKALVERLREVGRDGVWKSGRNPKTAHPMCIKAADRIEALSAEIKRLRDALELADAALSGANMNMNVVERKVRAALKGTKCTVSQED